MSKSLIPFIATLAAALMAAPVQAGPLSLEEALRSFQVKPGFHVELVAAEPEIRSPVAIDFDEDRRLYVVEYTEYNDFAATRPHGASAIRLLEDRDGDGRYEHSTAFADDVKFASGVLCYDGGVFVAAAPDILYLKDTNGDGRADVRERLFTGFARDHAGEAMLNSLRWGPDNRIHVSAGLIGGLITRVDRPNERPISIRNMGMAFDPRTRAWTVAGGGGQYGMVFDDWGVKFASSNSTPVWQVMYDSRYLARNPAAIGPNAGIGITQMDQASTLHRISKPEPWRVARDEIRNQQRSANGQKQPYYSYFSSGTGLAVYRGNAYPATYRGNVFVGEVAGNLLHRFLLEPNGPSLKAVDADADSEFLASTDNWFRPVQTAASPDGCLCVVDMYRELIEGADFLPERLLKTVDPSGGIDRGRIYRIVPDKFVRPKPQKLSKASTAELVPLLASEDGWHCDTAARLLYERRDPAANVPLWRLQRKSSSPVARMRALYMLASLGAAKSDDVVLGLSDEDPRVRQHAAVVAEQFANDGRVLEQLVALAGDKSADVRRQVAFSLGFFPQRSATAALAKIASQDRDNQWTRLAVLCSSAGRAGDLAELLAADAFAFAVLDSLAAQIGAAHHAPDINKLLAVVDRLAAQNRSRAQQVLRRMMFALPAHAAAVRLEGESAKLWAGALADARRTAEDPKQAPAARAAAVQALVFLPLADVQPLLGQLLAANQPQPVQAAVLKHIARYHEPAVAELVLSAWSNLGPAMRAAAIELLLSRPAWARSFLAAVGDGRVAKAEVDAGRVQLLTSYPDAEVRRLAAALFVAEGNKARAAVVANYRPALAAAGNIEHGREVFRKNCSACHRLEQFGTQLGADLGSIFDRGKEAVLLNILDPNREVKPTFIVYTAATDDGQVVTGLVSGETPTSLTIVQADGQPRTLLRSEIEQLSSTGRSFMPEGLEKQVSVSAMADLLEYLCQHR